MWYQPKEKHINEWNRTESQEISPHTYDQITFDKGAETILQEGTIQWGKRQFNGERTVFSTNDVGKTGYTH